MEVSTKPARSLLFELVQFQWVYVRFKAAPVESGITETSSSSTKLLSLLIFKIGGSTLQWSVVQHAKLEHLDSWIRVCCYFNNLKNK